MASKKKKSTFGEISSKWLEMKKGQIKMASYPYYKRSIDKICDKISGMDMEKICKRESLEWLEKEFFNEGYASRTVENFMVMTKAVIHYYRENIETVGYAGECDIMVCTQAKKIIAKAKDDKGHTDFKNLGNLIIMYTGITVSELCALKWENISLQNLTLTVKEAAARITLYDEGKTEISVSEVDERCIPICAQLEKILKEYMKNVKCSKDYILTNSDKLLEPRNFQNYVKTFCKKQLKDTYTPSDFRDMFIVTALKNGMSPIVLADILGVTIQHLYKRYGELIASVTEELKRAEINKMKY